MLNFSALPNGGTQTTPVLGASSDRQAQLNAKYGPPPVTYAPPVVPVTPPLGGGSSASPSPFGGNIIPRATPPSMLAGVDKTLSDISSATGHTGLLSKGAETLASGAYNAAKGIGGLAVTAGKDVFDYANHPIDQGNKLAAFLINELKTSVTGNESETINGVAVPKPDAVGSLLQGTVGSKGLGGLAGTVPRNLATASGGVEGMKPTSPHEMASLGLNSLLTVLTAGGGGLTEQGVKTALEKGYITPAVAAPLTKVAQSLLGKSLESGAVGAGFQASANIGEGRPVGDNVGKAFATGAAVPGEMQALGKVVSKISGGESKIKGEPTPAQITRQEKAIDTLESDYYKWNGRTKPGAKKIVKMDARTEALNRAGTTGRTSFRTLSEDGIIPETEGSQFRTENQAKTYEERIQPLHDALGEALKEVNYAAPVTPVKELRAQAIERVKSNTKLPRGDQSKLIKDINSEFDLMEEAYPKGMSATDMFNEKPAYWGGTKFDGTKPFQGEAYYQVGKSLQKAIEDKATQAGFDDVAQLNREIGDRLEAVKTLREMNGQVLKGGRLGKHVTTLIGSSLGKTVVGKILGAMGGEAVGNMLMRADVSTPVKRLLLRDLERKSPEAYQATLEWMDEQNIAREGRLALPEGNPANIAIPLEGEKFKSQPLNIEGEKMKHDSSRLNNIKALPPGQKPLITPNTQGTPNMIIAPYEDGGNKGAVGGLQQRVREGMNKVEQSVKDYVKEPKLGLSMQDITKHLDAEDRAIMQEFSDTVFRDGKTPGKGLQRSAQAIADAMNLPEGLGTHKALAEKFNLILDASRKDPTRNVPLDVTE